MSINSTLKTVHHAVLQVDLRYYDGPAVADRIVRGKTIVVRIKLSQLWYSRLTRVLVLIPRIYIK
jgi:hypothetical protein